MVSQQPDEGPLIDARRAQQPEYFLDALQAAAHTLGARVMVPGEEEDANATCPQLTYLPPNATRFEFARCQRVQRFPGMRQMCNKVPLAKLLHLMQAIAPPEHSSFVPAQYRMPAQLHELSEAEGWLIVKPNSGTRGDGIAICEGGAAAIARCGSEECVVQRYLAPLLWHPSGQKWDLRLYVLVTAVMPSVEAWIMPVGIARLCAEQYAEPTNENCTALRGHLSNTAVNSEAGDQCKHSLQTALSMLDGAGVGDSKEIWRDIRDRLVANTLAVMQPGLQSAYRAAFGPKSAPDRCYQVLGFDVMLDSNAETVLLEINANPSFAIPTELDRRIKTAVLGTALSRVLGVSNEDLLPVEAVPVPGPDHAAGVLTELQIAFQNLKPNSAGIVTGKSVQRVERATKQFPDLDFSAALRGGEKGVTKKLSWDSFSEGVIGAVASGVSDIEERRNVLRCILGAIESE